MAKKRKSVVCSPFAEASGDGNYFTGVAPAGSAWTGDLRFGRSEDSIGNGPVIIYKPDQNGELVKTGEISSEEAHEMENQRPYHFRVSYSGPDGVEKKIAFEGNGYETDDYTLSHET